MQVKWLRTALRNLDEQISFISEDNPQAAARASARILIAVERLEQFPELGRPGRVSSTRELVIAGTRWIVIYRIGDSIEILRVLHTAQRWPPARRR
jgi:addiction module RelE/StbE family toxin